MHHGVVIGFTHLASCWAPALRCFVARCQTVMAKMISLQMFLALINSKCVKNLAHM